MITAQSQHVTALMQHSVSPEGSTRIFARGLFQGLHTIVESHTDIAFQDGLDTKTQLVNPNHKLGLKEALLPWRSLEFCVEAGSE